MPISSGGNTLFINLKDYCKIDGTSDDSIGFTAAYTLASTLGMALWHPGGTLVKGNDTLLPLVHIHGSGRDNAFIKLKNGANTDLFSAHTANININIPGAGGPGPTSADAVYGFGFHDITLDGNRAGQTGGTSFVLRFYGYGFKFTNVFIEHGYSGGVLHDYHGPFPDQNLGPYTGDMEPELTNVKIMYNNGIGIEHNGPTDAQWLNIEVAESGSHNIHTCPNAAGLQATNVHSWYPGQGNNSVAWLIEGSMNACNCEAEGSDTVNVALLSTSCSWIGGSIFGAGIAGDGIRIGQSSGGTPYAHSVYSTSGVADTAYPNFYHISTYFNQLTGPHGAIWYDQQGIGTIDSVIYGGSLPTISGTPDPNSIEMISIIDTNGEYVRTSNLQPVPWALTPDFIVASSGGGIFALTANTTYIAAVTVKTTMTLTGFHIRFTNGGNGHYDIALYDSSGNRKAHTGSVSSVTGQMNPSLSGGNVAVYPGKYYMVFCIDNVTDALICLDLNGGVNMCGTGASSGTVPLPSTYTFSGLTTTSGAFPVLYGLLSGGWTF